MYPATFAHKRTAIEAVPHLGDISLRSEAERKIGAPPYLCFRSYK